MANPNKRPAASKKPRVAKPGAAPPKASSKPSNPFLKENPAKRMDRPEKNGKLRT